MPAITAYSICVRRAQRGIFFVIRPRGNLAVSTLDGQRLSLAPYLRQQTGKVIDLSVRLGSIPALWLTARLLALPVSPEIAEQRRAHVREKAKSQGHLPSAEALALADWNLIVTNIPATLLQAQEVLLLYRARWQVELLFKLWKSHGHVDEWSSCIASRISSANSMPSCWRCWWNIGCCWRVVGTILIAVGAGVLTCCAIRSHSCSMDFEVVSLWIRFWNSFTNPLPEALLFLHEPRAPVLPISFLMGCTGA